MMNCKKIRILLSAYIDRELAGKEEESVNEHLKVCRDCSEELEYLKQTKKLFLYKEKVEPPPFFETRLFNRIDNAGAIQPSLRGYFNVVRKMIPVFLILSVIGIGIFVKEVVFLRATEEYLFPADLLFSQEVEESFNEELIQIYYGSP
jgi:predicted anti-sigma-YlaC factor YlaD